MRLTTTSHHLRLGPKACANNAGLKGAEQFARVTVVAVQFPTAPPQPLDLIEGNCVFRLGPSLEGSILRSDFPTVISTDGKQLRDSLPEPI
jgi:hypothetical protein